MTRQAPLYEMSVIMIIALDLCGYYLIAMTY